jgi:hypothetical protein
MKRHICSVLAWNCNQGPGRSRVRCLWEYGTRGSGVAANRRTMAIPPVAFKTPPATCFRLFTFGLRTKTFLCLQAYYLSSYSMLHTVAEEDQDWFEKKKLFFVFRFSFSVSGFKLFLMLSLVCEVNIRRIIVLLTSSLFRGQFISWCNLEVITGDGWWWQPERQLLRKINWSLIEY